MFFFGKYRGKKGAEKGAINLREKKNKTDLWDVL